MVDFGPIGKVKSEFKEPINPAKMKDHISRIVVEPEYREGLYRIEESQYLQIIFYLNLSEGYNLKGERRHGEVLGVFASRSPRRPNPIGLTTVELLERNDLELTVKGLDAVDETPILDIKPYVPSLDDFKK